MNDFEQIRRSLGITQERCGEILGLSQSAISRLESGKVKPRLSELYILKLRDWAKRRHKGRAA